MSRQSQGLSAIPTEVQRQLAELGARIRALRIARRLTVAEMAQRLLCAPATYRALEAGKPTCSIGHLANALWLLGQMESLDQVARLPADVVPAKRVRRTGTAGRPDLTEQDVDF